MAFSIVQKDTNPPISSRLTDSGEPVDLSNSSNVFFHMEDEYNRVVISDDITGRVNITDESRGRVEYVFSESDTESVGTYEAEWEVLYDDGTRETFPSNRMITVNITSGIQ